jgi:hypothetical protein
LHSSLPRPRFRLVKLGSFCTFAPSALRRLGVPARLPSMLPESHVPGRRNWLRLARLVPPELGSFRAIHPRTRTGLPEIGFVLHNPRAPGLPDEELASFPEAGHRGDVAQSPPVPAGLPRIGFVLRGRPVGAGPAGGELGSFRIFRPGPDDAHARPKLGSFCTTRPRGSEAAAQTAIAPPQGGPQSAIRDSRGTRSDISSFRFQIVNHNSQIINPRGSASAQSIPLHRGRVARIVPEFCAHATPENRASPCA